MSLINEALKKAQSDRPAAPKHLVAGKLGTPAHIATTPRKRNYLWGFLVSVIIVGLFSASMTTFLVYYILGDDQPSPEAANAEPATVIVATAEAPAEAVPSEPPPVAETIPEPTAPKTAAPVEKIVEPVKKAAPVAQPAPPPAKVQPVAPVVQGPSNPAVWARLGEMEIRGIMGGGTKVLIFDLSTGKTKSFVEGDLVDGPLGLQVVTIKSNAIVFKDYGGFEYNKSF